MRAFNKNILDTKYLLLKNDAAELRKLYGKSMMTWLNWQTALTTIESDNGNY